MRGDNYYRYTIKPGPPPAGATEPRLISTCADGLNIAFATKGPTIEGCRFSFMGDDSVNLHGATFVVLERKTPDELIVAWPYSREYLATVIPAGATVRRLRPGNYEVLGTAKLTAFEPLRERNPEHLKMIQQCVAARRGRPGHRLPNDAGRAVGGRAGRFPRHPGRATHRGLSIRDCVFEDHRARGLRIMASHGVIEAEHVSPAENERRHGGRRVRVLARGRLGRGRADPQQHDRGRRPRWGESRAARPTSWGRSAFSDARTANRSFPLWPGNRDIVIEGNTIRDCPSAGIFVRGSQGRADPQQSAGELLLPAR